MEVIIELGHFAKYSENNEIFVICQAWDRQLILDQDLSNLANLKLWENELEYMIKNLEEIKHSEKTLAIKKIPQKIKQIISNPELQETEYETKVFQIMNPISEMLNNPIDSLTKNVSAQQKTIEVNGTVYSIYPSTQPEKELKINSEVSNMKEEIYELIKKLNLEPEKIENKKNLQKSLKKLTALKEKIGGKNTTESSYLEGRLEAIEKNIGEFLINNHRYVEKWFERCSNRVFNQVYRENTENNDFYKWSECGNDKTINAEIHNASRIFTPEFQAESHSATLSVSCNKEEEAVRTILLMAKEAFKVKEEQVRFETRQPPQKIQAKLNIDSNLPNQALKRLYKEVFQNTYKCKLTGKTLKIIKEEEIEIKKHLNAMPKKKSSKKQMTLWGTNKSLKSQRSKRTVIMTTP